MQEWLENMQKGLTKPYGTISSRALVYLCMFLVSRVYTGPPVSLWLFSTIYSGRGED
ncbi:hypothetical protein BDV19DRAFT_361534 [Aspergillus venezuelensis]